MNEDSSITPAEAPDGSDAAVFTLLKKMQQQLLLLERKVDLLISQSKERPHGQKAFPDRPFRKRPFTKQFHPSDQPRHHGRGEHGKSSGESDSAKGHFYEPHLRGRSRGAFPKKKPNAFKRKDQE